MEKKSIKRLTKRDALTIAIGFSLILCGVEIAKLKRDHELAFLGVVKILNDAGVLDKALDNKQNIDTNFIKDKLNEYASK